MTRRPRDQPSIAATSERMPGRNGASAEADDHSPLRVDAVQLKNGLCDVETDCRDLLHVWLFRIVIASSAATSVALTCQWKSRPQHQERSYADVGNVCTGSGAPCRIPPSRLDAPTNSPAGTL